MTRISNIWGMTTQQQVDYWSDATSDAVDRDEKRDAEENLATWKSLRGQHGPDHVFDDLAEVNNVIVETSNQ